MSCDITQGRSVDCKNNIAGVKAVYFANYADLLASDEFTTDAAGFVTEIQTTAALPLFKYSVRPESCEASSQMNTDANSGTTFFSQSLNLSLIGLTKEDCDELKLLAYGRPNVIILDNNDNLFIFGARNGMNVTDSRMSIGRNFGDMHGFEISLEGKESEYCLWINPTAGPQSAGYPFDGLTTAPSVS